MRTYKRDWRRIQKATAASASMTTQVTLVNWLRVVSLMEESQDAEIEDGTKAWDRENKSLSMRKASGVLALSDMWISLRNEYAPSYS